MPSGYPTKFNEAYEVCPISECWEWLACVDTHGYGQFDHRTNPAAVKGWGGILAHRYAYFREHGPIPSGLSVMHSCDNTACVNPGHLLLGSQLENIDDMIMKRRSTRGRRWRQLTNPQIQEIKLLVELGNTLVSIARRFGVTSRTIRRVRDK